ncbi:MAG: Fe-S cluster protein [Gemmatimonadetes bacterium]|nr:Fe-S cluster protein [Gemmatimonadota bacterium]
MGDVVVGASILGGLGLFFGTVLAVSYRYLRVPEDPRLGDVEGMLPGNNCGACGEPGCAAFAVSLLAGKTTPGKCTVSSPENVDELATFLGVDAGRGEKLVARLHCAGGRAQAKQIAAYEGFESCRAAALVGGGGKGCSWGCLGLADCERACTFGAITMNSNGLPVVDVNKCTACNDCVVVCPRDLFELLPLRKPLLVQCRVPLEGAAARALCTAACDACGRCAQDAPTGVVQMDGGLPRVDYDRDSGPEATWRCPTRAIRWVPANQFLEDREVSRELS